MEFQKKSLNDGGKCDWWKRKNLTAGNKTNYSSVNREPWKGKPNHRNNQGKSTSIAKKPETGFGERENLDKNKPEGRYLMV
jgi:hypothetical protein